MKSTPLVAIYFVLAALAESTSASLLRAQEARLRPYDVVPPAWITPDGDSERADGDRDGHGSRAFVFPSLAPSDSVPIPMHYEIQKFFQQHNHFHETVFTWSQGDGSNQAIEIKTSRHEADPLIDVDIDAASLGRIRKLDWERFRQLQRAFLSWLFKHSNCGWFSNCEDRFTDQFHNNLLSLWKDHVLGETVTLGGTLPATGGCVSNDHVLSDQHPPVTPAATFECFSQAYLNPTSATKIEYSGTVAAIQEDPPPAMFATQIEPRQQLVVTWGNDNFYPGGAGVVPGGVAVLNSYSRVSSGSRTELQIVSYNGMRLFPFGSCVTQSVAEKGNFAAPLQILLPWPLAWAGLIGRNFVPIYNLFDLHNSLLLTADGPPAPGDLPACPGNTRKASKYMFLLSPASYVKADAGPEKGDIAQFENEARDTFESVPIPVSKVEDLKILARQFVIIGCDSADSDVLRGEWNRLIENAFAGSFSPGQCGDFVHGIFSGKSFVELRNHFSINGRPVDGALNPESFGQAIATSFAAHLNWEAPPGSAPLVELLRSPDPERKLGAGTIRIRFHTTMSQVLDQAYVFEGDEIYVGSISEIVR